MSKTNPDILLAKEISKYYGDPLGFVMVAFPWDTDKDLQIVELKEPWASRFNSKYGPDEWFCKFCDDLQSHIKKNKFNGKDPVEPYKDATSSGPGS